MSYLFASIISLIFILVQLISELEGRCTNQQILPETTEIRITNLCPYTIWPGIVSYGDSEILNNGGFELPPSSTEVIRPQNPGWSGKIWGRTGCKYFQADRHKGQAGGYYSFHCETGDCGNGLCCRNWTSSPPATSAEISFGYGEDSTNRMFDSYSVSLSDGYNLQLQVRPLIGSYIKETNKRSDCNIAGCFRDMNSGCPPELTFRGKKSGLILGCENPCHSQKIYNNSTIFISEEYKSCLKTSNGLCFQSIVEEACPYTLVYDKQVSNGVVYTCKRYHRSFASYEVIFCPPIA